MMFSRWCVPLGAARPIRNRLVVSVFLFPVSDRVIICCAYLVGAIFPGLDQWLIITDRRSPEQAWESHPHRIWTPCVFHGLVAVAEEEVVLDITTSYRNKHNDSFWHEIRDIIIISAFRQSPDVGVTVGEERQSHNGYPT